MKIDVHQHLWTEPLVAAMAARHELPFVRNESGLTVLYLAGERPYVVELAGEEPARRRALIELDGLDGALLCLSSPLGIERLPRREALELIEAYHEGALNLGAPFAVWGAIALDRPDPDDVDRLLERGCVGISLPAGALGGVEQLTAMRAVLARLEEHGAPLLVHPGPGVIRDRPRLAYGCSLSDPLWWAALTGYVAEMHAVWLAFIAAGRSAHPHLRVIFTMLAGLAPLHAERLLARGGPDLALQDALTFYETSSYGPDALSALSALVGPEQLLYGSDRPVVDPTQHGMLDALDWESIIDASHRALMLPREVLA